MDTNAESPRPQLVALEIDVGKLERLLDSGALCAADIHCVSCESRNKVKRICLKLCANNLRR